MEVKKASLWKDFVINRRNRLKQELATNPEHPFYERKMAEASNIYRLYTTEIGAAHQRFFNLSQSMYRTFASSMHELDSLLILPYAAGEQLTEADFHVIPWLSHAMVGAGTDPSDIHNFGPLETLIQGTVPYFNVGPKIQEWWSTISQNDAFRKVYTTLH